MLATRGTASVLRRNGIECEVVNKLTEDGPEVVGEKTIVDVIRGGEVDLVINTPVGSADVRSDGYEIRAAAVAMNIPCVTTVQGAVAAVQGISAVRNNEMEVRALQDLHVLGQ